ncbi:MAG: hypothetical protein E7667_03890 [Ruminococcaceae bacterium]|nr:hypothetical protein [Oscillospiraceae bacterium]
MKKLISALTVLCIFVLSLTACSTPEDEVIDSLGEYNDYECYSEGVFQDHTTYGKYYFDSIDLTDNKYFSQIQDEDIDTVNKIIDDFKGWVQAIKENNDSQELVVNYDFTKSTIDKDDYFYLETDTYNGTDGEEVLASYDLYFIDVQTNILYYFHNNI